MVEAPATRQRASDRPELTLARCAACKFTCAAKINRRERAPGRILGASEPVEQAGDSFERAMALTIALLGCITTAGSRSRWRA